MSNESMTRLAHLAIIYRKH